MYIPDTDDAAAPLASVLAGTAAAEFRALKGKINNLFLESNFNPESNLQDLSAGMRYVYSHPAGTSNDIFYGLAIDHTRNDIEGGASGGEQIVAAQLNARLGNNLDGSATNVFVFGCAIEAWTGETASKASLIGLESSIIQQDNTCEMANVGLNIVYKNRPDSRVIAGLGPFQGLGDDKYNANSRALYFTAFPRSPDGERCGWGRGIVFENACFDDYWDSDEADWVRPVGIDFREQDGPFPAVGAKDPWTAYVTPLKSGLTSAIALPEYMSITWDRLQFTRTYLDSDNSQFVILGAGASPTTDVYLGFDYANNYITIPQGAVGGAPAAADASFKVKIGATEYYWHLTEV